MFKTVDLPHRTGQTGHTLGTRMKILRLIFTLFAFSFAAMPAASQDAGQTGPLSFATIERPPFATMRGGVPSGFSLELMKAIAGEMDRPVEFSFYQSFPAMLSAVEVGIHDGAVANISITAARENLMDFSQPIFESGIGVLLLEEQNGNPIFKALLTRDFLFSILLALGVLFGSGMLMWVFERRVQPYFDRSGKEALFPSFWWALNVVVNGGFEERMPQSPMGRVFAVVLVVSSLFVVSIFVATITSATTVAALQDNIDSINDLEGSDVITVDGSTSADFLDARDIGYTAVFSPAAAFDALEAGAADAIVFDAPILSYYSATHSEPKTRILSRIYRRENYGIALPAQSALKEDIDRALLRLRENGTYDALVQTWFGGT